MHQFLIYQLHRLLMTCYTPTTMAPVDCCAPPYDPTQTDDVRYCLYTQLSLSRGAAVEEWSTHEAFGKGMRAIRLPIDIHVLQEYLMDQWNRLALGESVATVWADAKLACIARWFKCTYHLDLTNAYATVGLDDPDRPPPGTSIPVPE